MLTQHRKMFDAISSPKSTGSTGGPGACHYLTNRFQMEAPVAPSRSLREASVGMAEAFAKPSRSLLGGFSKPSAPATSS